VPEIVEQRLREKLDVAVKFQEAPKPKRKK